MLRAAVIDMGSNSFRLVVYGYEPGRFWQHVDEIREPVRVGQGMGDEATIKPDRIERAVRTANVFASFCRSAGIDDVTAVATSAIRIARNRDELLARVKEEAGLTARVIDEQEEARYGYLAVANSTTIEDGFGIDIGGGSVQVMRLADRRMTDAASWKLGAVRVSEAFLPDDGPASGKQLKALRKHVKSELEGCGWLDAGAKPRAVGIGGTIRNLASAAQRRAGLPETDAQGYLLTRDALEELIEELAGMPPEKRGGTPGIKPDRGDVILGGAVVLGALMDGCGAEAVEATDAGLREGVFFERFLDGGSDGEPLFPDVRGASVMNLAHRYMDDLRHPSHVARLSLEILAGLSDAGLYDVADADRELLWAACMLHDIGTAIDYDDHHKHSRYLILNARLPGFTPRELHLIGLIARYHRKGEPDVTELGKLAGKGDARRLAVLSGTIRLAEQLERSRDQSIEAVTVTSANGEVRLEPAARGDASVAIWSARRNADLLARAVEREVEIAESSAG